MAGLAEECRVGGIVTYFVVKGTPRPLLPQIELALYRALGAQRRQIFGIFLGEGIGIGVLLFGVPILGNLFALAALSTLFIATNLSIGYTFSTIAQNQLQAMQMSIMFFLPNILLSGFMFPFAGMPTWAQWVGEALPLTHYLRVVRSIMLKGSSITDLHYDAAAMFVLMLVAMTIAVTRFRRTLD